jgi:large subunit ribosomal protein L9
MKVILTQAVPGLGEAGTIKEVADGYARNFLLPRKLAVAATRGSVKQAEAQAEVYARRADKARNELQKAAGAVEGKTVRIYARVGSENRLYGSVTPADVADALSSQHGVTVDRRKVELNEAIHRTGTYTATADFGNGVTATLTVEVAPEAAGAGGRGAVDATAQADTTAEDQAATGSAETNAADVPEEVAAAEAEANPT